MASIVPIAIASGALGLLFGIWSTDSKMMEKIIDDNNRELIENCETCIEYIDKVGGIDSATLSALEVQKCCECARIKKMNDADLEKFIRAALNDKIDVNMMKKLAQKCKDITARMETQESEGTKKTETKRTEEEYIVFTGVEDWVSLSSFESESDGSVRSGVSPYTLDSD